MKNEFILYKIWYGNMISYVGQTIQGLETRMKQHFLYDLDLDLMSVSKIEYTILTSQANLNVYELYYINKYRAFENRNGLAHDKLTITLPELEWKEYDYQKLEKIKAKNKGVGIRSMPKNFCYDDRYN